MSTKATATLIQGMQVAIETGTGHALVVDSDKEEFGGRNTGPKAIELMAASIAGCTILDVVSILRKMQQKVTALSVKVETLDAEDHPKRFLQVQVSYSVTGFGLEEAKVKRAIELSETRYCPAMATVRPGAEIVSSYEIAEATQDLLAK